MKTVEATFKVVTPMFMAGNEHKTEFRIPSLLGCLRFWYRATAPGKLVADVEALRDAEAGLFGSVDRGQAVFLTRADTTEASVVKAAKAWWGEKQGLIYLGYGSVSNRGVQRDYIDKNSLIKVKFIFRTELSKDQPADIKGLIRAVKAMCLFGGTGSRSRRGFGSLTLIAMKDEKGREFWRTPRNQEELRAEIARFIKDLGCTERTTMPPYTAFSSMARVVITPPQNDALKALDEIGREMMRYRSYGQSRDGRPHRLPWKEEAEQNFADDHDLMLQIYKNGEIARHPRRVVFGLPHNYYFGSIDQKAEISGIPSERRASPLLIHIHEVDKKYCGVLTFLPAHFLPGQEMIKITGGRRTESVPCRVDWQVVGDFLDRFPDAMEVKA